VLIGGVEKTCIEWRNKKKFSLMEGVGRRSRAYLCIRHFVGYFITRILMSYDNDFMTWMY
jgi:hypothetical protein